MALLQKIYVIGGYTDPHLNSMIFARVTNLTQVYDPMLDGWSLGSEMPTAITGLYVFAVDDLFYTCVAITSIVLIITY